MQTEQHSIQLTTKPTDLSCESGGSLLSSILTNAILNYCLAQNSILPLFREGQKAKLVKAVLD